MQLAGERVLYVPPGRRLAAATASTSSISEVSDVKRETKLSSMDSFDSSFSVEEYCSSCLIVEGFTSNTSEIVKDNALQPFRDSGGESVWLGRTKCLLIYKSPSALNGALAGKGLNSSFRVVRLTEDYEDFEGALNAGKPIYESFKPKTTTKVANRLIGAALGIRMPAKKVEDPPLEKKQSVIVDAWDD